MSIVFSKQVALWPSSQIKQRQDAFRLYLIFVKDEGTFNGLPALLPAAEMAIIVAKINDSFFAKVVDEAGGPIVNKQEITDAALTDQLDLSLGDPAAPIEDPTTTDLQKIAVPDHLKKGLIDHLISKLGKQQDVYFQPGLTWTSKETQSVTKGVALLFLENDTNSPDMNKQDFRELVKGLVRWVWAAAGNDESSSVDQTGVQNVYDEFVTTSLSYADLIQFLGSHYHFNIQEYKEQKEMEGTVFPMFPYLEMIVGENPRISFSPIDRQLDDGKINNLRDYFSQLQVRFDTQGTSRQTISANSVTEFLFIGYIRLLIRNGLQAIIDYLKTERHADNIVSLLEEQDLNGIYRNIAQMASRFLLSGFNLPEKLLGWEKPHDDEEGLYASTGQQFTFSDSGIPSDTPTEHRVTLQLGDVTESFIHFPENASDGRPQIVYSMPDTEKTTHPLLKLANDLNRLTEANIAKLHSAQPKFIHPYRPENLHFALRDRVIWATSGKPSTYLLPLTTSLLHHLKQYEQNPQVDLRLWPNGNPGQASQVDNDDFTWATRIDLTLLRVPNPDGDGFLKETYEIGSSSEQDKDLLEAVWDFLNTTTETDPIVLNLLYISDEGAGSTNPTVRSVPGIQSKISLLKTNLSTETTAAPSVDFSAALTGKHEFLKLLWEALDVDTGGFYMYIPHGKDDLDETVFKDNSSAVFPFLIEFSNSDDPIHDFNNYAVFEKEIDVETDLVLARSSESVPILMIPPGFLGFQIDNRPEAFSANNDAADELSVLYQLLGWRVAENAPFKASSSGLPIGPTEHMEEKGKWLYERLVPVFSLVTPTTSDADPPHQEDTKLPPSEMDPYRGIGAASELIIETWWQDIYGNQLKATKAKQTFPIRYTDALIGINQWPSVSEYYEFVEEDGSRKINLSFAFDPTPYETVSPAAADPLTDSRANRIKADIATIEKVYYQLLQDDLDISISTSIDNHQWTHSVKKAEILRFIKSIFWYLKGSLTISSPTPATPEPYTESIDAGSINIRPGFIFPVTVDMEMRRSFELISDELKQKINVTSGQSLSQLSESFTAVELLLANIDHPGLFNAEIVLNPVDLTPNPKLLNIKQQDWTDYQSLSPAPTLTIQASETPRKLAERFNQDMEAKLGRTVNFTASDLAAILAEDVTVLKNGAGLLNGRIEDSYENVQRAPAVLGPRFAGGQIIVEAGQSLSQLSESFTAVELLLANIDHPGLFNAEIVLNPVDLTPDPKLLNIKQQDWTDYQSLSPAPTLTIQASETPRKLAERFNQDMEAKLGRTVNFTASDLAAILAEDTSLLTVGAVISIDLTIRPFAQNFQATFPGILLAVSEDRQNRSGVSQQPLYAVKLGMNGITYSIQKGQPTYYAIPPLSNVLLAREIPINKYNDWKGTITIPKSYDPDKDLPPLPEYKPNSEKKRFDAIDLNVLARGFLVALESFLAPETLIPAYQLFPKKVGSILQQKAKLANIMGSQVLPILDYDLQLIPDATDNGLPSRGQGLITVAKTGNTYHVRIFDLAGIQAIDMEEVTFESDESLVQGLEKEFAHRANQGKEINARTKHDLIHKIRLFFSEVLQAEKAAKEAIRQELLVDLVNGYDIETIIQFAVQVNVDNTLSDTLGWDDNLEPRIRGKAKVKSAMVGDDPNSRENISLNLLDFKLSDGKIQLRKNSGSTYFTYLFDTKTPELFANLELDLEFIPVEIEYDIQNLAGIAERQASNFLNFVLPEGLGQSMGKSAIPIPLREYPAPPSLILQRAEPDLSSLTEISDIRQWQYTIIYEHPDISQDSVDCILQLNVPPIDDNVQTESSITASTEVKNTGSESLFDLLMNFGEVYPQIAVDLNGLRSRDEPKEDAKKAIIAFESLVSNVAEAWKSWAPDDQVFTPDEKDLHFLISEEALSTNDDQQGLSERQGLVKTLKTVESKIGGPEIVSILALPGYKESKDPVIEDRITRFTFEQDPDDLTFFGDSSIPDRKFTVMNLDVIEHHNAWAKIWLSRNKDLIRDSAGEPLATNPAFVFQTPAVSFKNMATPFITNDEPWNIATLSDQPRQTLEHHLTKMVETLFPTFDGNKYEVRLSCRYAFSLSTGRGLNEDLVTTLPILLGIQVTPKTLTENYGIKLGDEIGVWLRDKQPSLNAASLIFTVDLFSKLNDDSTSSLPTLRITHLELKFTDIDNLNSLMKVHRTAE